ncbi:hypothetical protein M427DRAFT_177974 [Gonapodya prolifera JEL478]|uniref:SAC3/GANP/THP3 conserved domain-containing protein n=1 Tax=Gonapodya prolifera (strain JEL478) TaxID=1344416 RepID=A0A139AQ63_GONPJ|nr:hypothetical protein M427DRAFT_177974 [Gonapodya prolifera JEL478]|eukprot:KXS18868.1 hypothetical protein M427DRAFT_177974 [Gonapodya prolifera JEL478]
MNPPRKPSAFGSLNPNKPARGAHQSQRGQSAQRGGRSGSRPPHGRGAGPGRGGFHGSGQAKETNPSPSPTPEDVLQEDYFAPSPHIAPSGIFLSRPSAKPTRQPTPANSVSLSPSPPPSQELMAARAARFGMPSAANGKRPSPAPPPPIVSSPPDYLDSMSDGTASPPPPTTRGLQIQAVPGLGKFLQSSNRRSAKSELLVQDATREYNIMKADRERLKRSYVAQGKMADPDLPRSLDDAVHMEGECEEMCPVFERYERVSQQGVDSWEMDPNGDLDYDLMVGQFRRSEAGKIILPDEIRTPTALLQTLDHLLCDILVSSGRPLLDVHKFLDNRMRAISHDLSVQGQTGPEAMQLYEIMVRYVILAGHVCREEDEDGDNSPKQNLERLQRFLKSLMEIYDDNLGDPSPNEAEFRAYHLLLFPNENNLVTRGERHWRSEIFFDPRVTRAIELHQLIQFRTPPPPGARVTDAKRHIAQGQMGNAALFFQLVSSEDTDPLQACVAETYFDQVRAASLVAIARSTVRYKPSPDGTQRMDEWDVDEMEEMWGMDEGELEENVLNGNVEGVEITEKDDGRMAVRVALVAKGNFSKHCNRRIVDAKREGVSDLQLVMGVTRSGGPPAPLMIPEFERKFTRNKIDLTVGTDWNEMPVKRITEAKPRRVV